MNFDEKAKHILGNNPNISIVNRKHQNSKQTKYKKSINKR
jgi:hypothetical protein